MSVYGLAWLIVALLPALFAVGPSSPCKRATDVYTSPDDTLQAVVVTEATCEAYFDFQTTSPKRVLLSRDERSRDGDHGQRVEKAAWTQDSQFFAVSTTSTGGHQPWKCPLWIYSRARNQIFELDDFGAAATGKFTLKPGGTIQVRALGCGQDAENIPDRTLVFNPRRFLTAGHPPSFACRKR